MKSFKLPLSQFVFWGNSQDLRYLLAHYIEESMRYARRNDFASVLAIDKDLVKIHRFADHQLKLEKARVRSVNGFANC